jgi:hypothetical protein
MTLENAQRYAQELANRTGSSVLVYKSLLAPDEYGTEFTLPTWGERIGDRVYPNVKERLEYLRGELRSERISYSDLHELQTLAPHIDKGDVELLEAAGVPEFEEEI